MEVIVYGLPKCGKCTAAKDKMSRMAVPYTFVDLSNIDGWRETGEERMRDGQAEYEMRNREELPLIMIDGRWFTYPEAMAFLKRMFGG